MMTRRRRRAGAALLCQTPRLREAAIGEESRRLRLRYCGRPLPPLPLLFTEDEEEDLLGETTVYPPGTGARLQLLRSLQLEDEEYRREFRLAEQMPTADAETVTSESTAVIQQPSDSEEKDSTMVNVDAAGLHEQDELPNWMSQLFEKLDLEVDEDVVDEDICSIGNMTHEEEEADLERKLNKGIHPVVLALHVLLEEEEVVQEEDMAKGLAELDEYLLRHTYHTIEEGMAGIASGFQNPPPCPHLHNHTCEKVLQQASICQREDPRYRVPEEVYAHIDKEARDHWKNKKKISYKEQVQNGIKWMSEECFIAFRKYAEQLHLMDTEYKFGELLNQCLSVDGYSKNFHHFNFTVKEKPKNSDIWNSQLYFAEVKQLYGVKYYFCCLLDASDNGKCNGCHNQKTEDLIKHPSSGGYEKGDEKICWPFLDDTSYLSGSDDDDF
uniref:DUF3615 domain-containing protein n=1 Tax=Oryza meridionalis TaxID=40149 RepID=A0A0E0F272_9ORYZ